MQYSLYKIFMFLHVFIYYSIIIVPLFKLVISVVILYPLSLQTYDQTLQSPP